MKAAGGYEPKNIRFFTYAKFIMISEETMAEIRPEIIIYDEFYCSGATLWSQGIGCRHSVLR